MLSDDTWTAGSRWCAKQTHHKNKGFTYLNSITVLFFPSGYANGLGDLLLIWGEEINILFSKSKEKCLDSININFNGKSLFLKYTLIHNYYHTLRHHPLLFTFIRYHIEPHNLSMLFHNNLKENAGFQHVIMSSQKIRGIQK